MTSDFGRQSFSTFGRLGPGSRIAGYLLEKQIGTGGMSVVFRARDETLRRLAAVKVIAPSMADDQEFRARFLWESQAAAAVDSPHITPVYAAGEHAGLLYIATRFVAGGDLAALADRHGGQLPAGRAGAIVTQVASALDAAHAAGLVHRDVKLANILVDTVPGITEHAYLSDFGLSKGMSSTSLTAPGQFVGTPDYSAPEQINGDSVDGRADQYALACVAFALLTGTPPFRRRDALGTLSAHLQDPVPLVTQVRRDLPAAVDGVIARALAKSPADRYDHCGEFAAALRQALSPAPVPAGRAAHRSQARRRRRSRSRVVRTAGITVVVVVVAGIAAAAVLHDRSSDASGSAPASSPVAVRSAPPDPDAGQVMAVRVLAGSYYAFDEPDAVTTDGSDLWVANYGTDTVTELNAGTGQLVQELAGREYGFDSPDLIADHDGRVWVGTGVNDLAELNAGTSAVIRVLPGARYGFGNPVAIAFGGGRVWVANYGGNTVTELNASTGALIRVIYGFVAPGGIAVDGDHVWVTDGSANGRGDSVTELNASTGRPIRVLSGGEYDFNQPEAITADGNRIWVANSSGRSVTEVNASDGTLIRVLSGASYGFNNPQAIAVDDGYLWVANDYGDSVTELNASDGNPVQILSGARYRFSEPDAIAVAGKHVWVTNSGVDGPDGSVTELTTG